MRNAINKRSIVIDTRKTSISMEKPFWDALKAIAKHRNMNVADLVSEVDRFRHENAHANLSSSIRIFVLANLQDRVAAAEKSASDTAELEYRGYTSGAPS